MNHANCTRCYEPIPEGELTYSEDIGDIKGTPYHHECLQKTQEEFSRDIERNLKKKEQERETKEGEIIEIALKLAKGNGFLAAAERLSQEQPIYYDKTGAWWVWNNTTKSWEMRDDTDILVLARHTIRMFGDTSVKYSRQLVEALRQVGRALNPEEPPVELIQFGTTLYNIKTGEEFESTPKYFSTNPIPWKLGESEETPVLDELITQWVGRQHKQTLYEIFAYCLYRDYPIHRVFCFVGSGANGKTRVFRVIEKLVGQQNKSSVMLRKISTNDFALYQLYRKLVCFVGETTHHKLETTEIIKALSGQDPVNFEAKGKNSFTGTNYAKLIVGTNTLPTSSDTSRGWYRRWFVINFPNEFTEGEDVLQRVPDVEYENLCRKSVRVLKELLERGGFSEEGTIEDRQEQYIQNSNPLKSFLDRFYLRQNNERTRYAECYNAYLAYLQAKKLRRISKKEFTQALEDEGLETHRTSVRDPISGEITSFTFIGDLTKRPQQDTLTTHTIDAMATINNRDMRVVSTFIPGNNTLYNNQKVRAQTHTLHNAEEHAPTILEIAIGILRENQTVPKAEFEETFPELDVTRLLTEGILSENKKGWLKVVE